MKNLQPSPIKTAILELMSDGRERRTSEISSELSARLDRAEDSVCAALSKWFANDRRFERRRTHRNGEWIWRMCGVVQ